MVFPVFRSIVEVITDPETGTPDDKLRQDGPQIPDQLRFLALPYQLSTSVFLSSLSLEESQQNFSDCINYRFRTNLSLEGLR
jgi:hypothetical protein